MTDTAHGRMNPQMIGWYTRDGEPLSGPDELARTNEWKTMRRVGITDVGGFRVSTVFLSLDHDHDDKGRPLIFETMVFGGDPDEYLVARYATEEEAMRGHLAVVDALRAGVPGEEALRLARVAVRKGRRR